MGTVKVLFFISSFTALAGFALGVFFLFFVSTPVEDVLKRSQVSQGTIDLVMNVIIFIWAAVSLAATFTFHRGITRDRVFRSFAVYIIAGLFIVCSGIFYTLLSTDSALMAVIKGVVTESRKGFAYGPYPTEAHLRILKKGGHTGVITLLSPTIPFEKILLDKEIEAGRKIGMEVHSFPMLPWVSSNKVSIEKIKELVKSGKGRYYVHCNLGKHRTNLARMIIEETLGEAGGSAYVVRIERGELKYYQNKRIILGPLPVQDEWLDLVVRCQIREVISYLDPDNREDAQWIEKERFTCEGLGLAFKVIPVKRMGSGFTGVEEIINHVKNSNSIIYIHGYNIDDKNLFIDKHLKLNNYAPFTSK